jgi:hypothetical protein
MLYLNIVILAYTNLLRDYPNSSAELPCPFHEQAVLYDKGYAPEHTMYLTEPLL